MKSKPDACRPCPLYTVTHFERGRPITRVGTGWVDPEGVPVLGVTFVGEAAGAKEEVAGLPFRMDAQAGAILERAFRRIGVSRGQVAIGNVLSCRPPNNLLTGEKYEAVAISHCAVNRDSFLDRSIDYATKHCKQSVVVALGDVAFRTLTGLTGDRLSISYTRGYPIMTASYGLVMGTYHPAYVARKRKYFGVLVEDLLKAFEWAKNGFVEYPRNYLEYPDESQKRDFRDRYLAHPEAFTLSYDLESDDIPEGRKRDEWPRVKSWQLSLGPGEGIFLDAVEDRPIIEQCLASQGDKIGHNCFHRHTSVWMADGSWRPIWKVKDGERVKTMASGVLTDRPASVFKTHDDRPWVEVVVDGAYNRGVGRWGNSGVVCTPDHEWITPSGTRVGASALKHGDEVLLPQQGSREVLFGSLLGDGHALEKRPLFKCAHTNKEWAEAKANCFGVKLHPRVQKTGYKPGTIAYEFEVSIPTYWRERFYRRDKTRKWSVPNNWALAVWYCDDGTSARKNGEPYSAKLSLHKYAIQETEIRAWFVVAFGSNSMENGSISLHREASLKFWDCIAEYVHPSMYYKLPLAFQGRYNGWMEVREALIGRVSDVKPRTPKTDARTKYCLTVEETHAFFTRAGYTANCWDFDDEVAKANGLVINGRRDDSLWMFAHYQPDIATEDAKADLDDDEDFRLSTSAGLQFVASFCGMDFIWKNLNRASPRFYGIADVDACSRIKVTLPPKMKALGIWDGYETKVRLKPILTAAENRGLWYDLDGRDILHAELQTAQFDLDGKLQRHHPDALKNLHPPDGFVRTPTVGDKIRKFQLPLTDVEPSFMFEWLDDDAVTDSSATPADEAAVDEAVEPGLVAVSGLWRPMVHRKFAVKAKTLVKRCSCVIEIQIPRVSAKTGKPIKPEIKYEFLANCVLCHGAGKYATYANVIEERWARLKPFKPSNKQLVTYMRFKGHKVPYDRKLGRETTNAEKLGEMARKTRDPLYQTVLDIRTVSKIDSTYVTGQ